MKYVIYCAHTSQGDIINMTHNPYIDYAFIKESHDIYGFEILTPDLDISRVNYIMRSMNKEPGPVRHLLLRNIRSSSGLKMEHMKKAMLELGINYPRKFRHIINGENLGHMETVYALHSLLKGRIMDYCELDELIKCEGIFLEDNVYDMLQILYLKRHIDIIPSIRIDKPWRKYTCRHCEEEIHAGALNAGSRCPACGSYIDFEEPLFACGIKSEHGGCISIKYKAYKKLTLYQDRAVMELSSFLDNDRDECLLWTVPGAEDINITSNVTRDVLARGGRVGIGVSCSDDGKDYCSVINETFPNTPYVFHEGPGLVNKYDITILNCKDIRRYYKSFDLIILNECPVYPMGNTDTGYILARRALKEKGKIIHATSVPDFHIYNRAIKGTIKLITVPLRKHGKPSPEPRILTYKALASGISFIPGAVLDFILWSINEKVRVRIIVPEHSMISELRYALLNCGEVKEEWLDCQNPGILIATLPLRLINVEEEENIIVFMADDNTVFDEKNLLKAAAIPGRYYSYKSGEVIFVGARESDEMYNTRMMLRSINKSAWEMGYLK